MFLAGLIGAVPLGLPAHKERAGVSAPALSI